MQVLYYQNRLKFVWMYTFLSGVVDSLMKQIGVWESDQGN